MKLERQFSRHCYTYENWVFFLELNSQKNYNSEKWDIFIGSLHFLGDSPAGVLVDPSTYIMCT